MRGNVLMGCALVVLGAVATPDHVAGQATAGVVNVDVRVDCLAGRGLSFSLTPWLIAVQPGDSVNWRLEFGSNVTDMDIVNRTPGNQWPFLRKPPYRATRDSPAGARARDNSQGARSRYKYAVTAVCARSATESDTVVIDPDMIIIRR